MTVAEAAVEFADDAGLAWLAEAEVQERYFADKAEHARNDGDLEEAARWEREMGLFRAGAVERLADALIPTLRAGDVLLAEGYGPGEVTLRPLPPSRWFKIVRLSPDGNAIDRDGRVWTGLRIIRRSEAAPVLHAVSSILTKWLQKRIAEAESGRCAAAQPALPAATKEEPASGKDNVVPNPLAAPPKAGKPAKRCRVRAEPAEPLYREWYRDFYDKDPSDPSAEVPERKAARRTIDN